MDSKVLILPSDHNRIPPLYANNLFLLREKLMCGNLCRVAKFSSQTHTQYKRIKISDEYIDFVGTSHIPHLQKEHQSYFETDRKPQIKQHPSCNLPAGQLQMKQQPQQQQQQQQQQQFYYGPGPAGGNHQVPAPGNDDAINYETTANEFYTEHAVPQVMHQGDEMYQGTFPNNSHQQIHPLPISEGSTSSLPVAITPYTQSTTCSAPPSPSVGFELDSSQYITSNSSAFHEPIMSPFSAGPYQQFSYEDALGQVTPTRGPRDPRYSERRRKNNEASKKSRAKKKEKAKEMESKAITLEQENRQLRQKYSELEQEVAVYKKLTETITTCDSQECITPSCLTLQQQIRSQTVRANSQYPE